MVHQNDTSQEVAGYFLLLFFGKAGAWCAIGDENSPGSASAYRGAKTVLRTVFRARESPRFNGSMMGMRVEKRVVDPYSIRYYKTAGVFIACRLLFIGEIFSIAFYKELRLNKMEFVYQMFSINSSIKRFICSGLSVLELCPAPSIHFKGILLFRCHALL